MGSKICLITTRMCYSSYCNNKIFYICLCLILQQHLQLYSPTPTYTPWMLGKYLPGHISHTDKIILCASIVQMLHNRSPHLPLRWLLRRAWLAPYTKHSTHLRTHRSTMSSKQDYCRGSMPGDIRSRGVNHVRQVNARKELLDQLLAKFALHERIGGNHANIAGRLRVIVINR